MIFLTSHIRFGHTTAIAAAIMCFSPDLVVVMIVIMRDHSYTSGYVSRLISDDIQLTTTDATSGLLNGYHNGSVNISIDSINIATKSASTQQRRIKQIKQRFLTTP